LALDPCAALRSGAAALQRANNYQFVGVGAFPGRFAPMIMSVSLTRARDACPALLSVSISPSQGCLSCGAQAQALAMGRLQLP